MPNGCRHQLSADPSVKQRQGAQGQRAKPKGMPRHAGLPHLTGGCWKASPARHTACAQQLPEPANAALATCHTKKPNVQHDCHLWQGGGPRRQCVLAAARFAVVAHVFQTPAEAAPQGTVVLAQGVWAPHTKETTRPEEPAVRNFGDPLRGWQRAATASLDAAACESLLSDLDPASRALPLSQAGPGGSRAITALPTSPELRMPSECMRVVLLRWLRLPLPHAPRQCRCGGSLNPLGDHRAACPVAGVLGLRGAPLERICGEGGARVATNVFWRDMNVDVPLADSRRIEVLANGLPMWQGAQVVVDTTFVSPVSRDGSARAGADRVPGKAAADHRWAGMLAVAAQRALAWSILELPLDMADECDGTEPPLADVLADARHTLHVPASRLPARS